MRISDWSSDVCSSDLFYLFLRLQRRRCRGEACDGNAIGRRGNIIEARLLTECNGSRVPSMLAANAKLDPWTSRSPAFGSEFDQLTNAFDVQAHEGITGENALVDILRQETACVVATDANSRLREIVGAE